MIFDDSTITSFRKTESCVLLSKPSSLSYISSGDYLMLTSLGCIQIYDTLKPELATKIDISNDKAEFFIKNTILVSQKKSICYLSTYDTHILRRFTLSSEIKDLSCGTGDLFMVNADDVHIYDIRSISPCFKINLENTRGAFIDDFNVRIANSSVIRFYDLRYMKGPTKLEAFTNIKSMKYNMNAEKFVIETNNTFDHTISDFYMNVESTIEQNSEKNGALTPDGKYYAVSHKGFLRMHNLTSKKQVCDYRDSELDEVLVGFNPIYGQMVTGGNNLLRFWHPEEIA